MIQPHQKLAGGLQNHKEGNIRGQKRSKREGPKSHKRNTWGTTSNKSFKKKSKGQNRSKRKGPKSHNHNTWGDQK